MPVETRCLSLPTLMPPPQVLLFRLGRTAVPGIMAQYNQNLLIVTPLSFDMAMLIAHNGILSNWARRDLAQQLPGRWSVVSSIAVLKAPRSRPRTRQ
jgi:hypothetical protein